MSRPILTPDEMRAAEQAVFDTGTDSFDVMRLAGTAVAEFLHGNWPTGRIQVLCGPGGNGGDGFIAAATLKQKWRDVEVFSVGDVDALSGDVAKAAKLWGGPVRPLGEALEVPHEITLDALFGGGLSRPLEGEAAALAGRPGLVVSVDVPSGLAGLTGVPMGPCFRAAATMTFAALRPAHVLQPGASFCGNVAVADIRVPIETNVREDSPALWGRMMPRPGGESHKHTRGHLAVVSGGMAQTGAARLAARAGLRAGAGLVTVLSPPSAMMVNAAHLTAVMLRSISDPDALKTECEGKTAVVIGPAAGISGETRTAVEALLGLDMPVVLDADALTVFREEPKALFGKLRASDVMTPHVGEFGRLFGDLLETSINRIEAVRAAAGIAGCVVLLKGADTVIAAPDGRVVVNNHATPWLATAGSGDVLAGIIGGLVAQGMDSLEAAAMGAWVHGEAGRRVGAGLIAEDLEAMLPNILSALHGEL